MKKRTLLKTMLLAAMMLPVGAWAQTVSTANYGVARQWNFKNWSTATVANLEVERTKATPDVWGQDAEKN